MEAQNRSETSRYESSKRFLRAFTLSILFGFLSIAHLTNLALASDPHPRLLVDSAVYNFGIARQGDKVATSFKIKNAGDAELLIQRVVPACGCTTSTPSKDKLSPGESTDIKVVFDTTGFSGEKLKTVRIFSNDPDQPSAVLTIQGVVEPDVTVDPTRLIFPEIVRGEAAVGATQEFTVTVKKGASVKLGTPLASSTNFTVTELPGGTNTAKRISVVLNPDLPPGEFRERVVIPLEHGSSSSLNVPVVATIKGTMELRPMALSFGVLEGEQPIQKIVTLQNLSTSPVAIESISSDNLAVTAVLRPSGDKGNRRQDGRHQEIVVTVDPGKIASDLKANITIKTSRKSEPALVLGVYGIRPVS